MKNNKLDDIHTDYKNIAIPEDLRRRVEETIKQAKEETAMNKSKNKVFKIMKGTAGTAVAAMLAITVLANADYTIANAMNQIPVIGNIAKVVTFRTYEKNEGDMEAKVDVPKVTIDGDTNLNEATNNLNKSVEEYTNEIIAMFEKDVATYGEYGKEDLNTSYKVVTDNDKLFSLRIDTDIAVGSSDSFSKIYHIDKSTGKEIELKDLFQENSDYVTAISENLKAQMREQMKTDENVSYFVDTDIEADNFKSIKEDQNFYINEDGKLVIVFDKYEVAPGYMGKIEMVVPTDVIENIVNDGFVK